jgi:hypothetical protein
MKDQKPASQSKPVDRNEKDQRERSKQDKGLDRDRSGRTPDTEPPKDKRSDDL